MRQAWWLIPVILATQEAQIRRIKVQSQVRQKVALINKSAYYPSDMGGINKKIMVQPSLGINIKPYSKTPKAKRTGVWLK
jgi:hypothetical protein